MQNPGAVALVAILAISAACGSVNDQDADAGVPDAALPDAAPGAPDAAPRMCAHDAPFTSFAPLGGVNTGDDEQNAWFTHDELTMLFSRTAVGTQGGDLFVAQRASRAADFGSAVPLTELNSGFQEYRASLSDDGRTIYFDRRDTGNSYTILTAVRADTSSAFGAPGPLARVNGNSSSFEPFVAAEGLYFGSTRMGGISDLYFAPRSGAGFGEPVPLTELNSSGGADEVPVPSLDGLAVYYSTNRTPNHFTDVWVATRSAPGASFTTIAAVASLDTGIVEYPNWLSDDNCRLYFVKRDTGGSDDFWVASR